MINEILKDAVNQGASYIFLIAGMPVTFQIGAIQERQKSEKLKPDDIQSFIDEIYSMNTRTKSLLIKSNTDDFSFAVSALGRFRINIFRQRGSYAAVIRIIRFELPDAKEMGIPEEVLSLADEPRGLVLVTGDAGSGKSTTLACMIDRINTNRSGHIITLEDPIEYVHHHKQSIVSQKEISIDTPGYSEGLKATLREKPNVILVGELSDEIIPLAITAVETGVMMLSSMYTSNAVETISRIIDAFPENRTKQASNRVAQLLKGIVCQKLLPSVDGSHIPVFEILRINPVIQDMIRKNNFTKIEAVMASDKTNMRLFDDQLLTLYKEGKISKETVLNNCSHYDAIISKLGY